jgi:hypothetical protein
MYKVKQVLTLAALTTGFAVSLMLASSAGAATVTHQILLPGRRGSRTSRPRRRRRRERIHLPDLQPNRDRVPRPRLAEQRRLHQRR